MSKEERRQLFEAQVKAEDELNAERQRQHEALMQQQQAAAALFLQQNPAFAALHALGIDPSVLSGQGAGECCCFECICALGVQLEQRMTVG